MCNKTINNHSSAGEQGGAPRHTIKPPREPADGAELLEKLARWVRSYVWLPGGAADAIALWVVATWCVEEIYMAPILSVLSATKQCGKTTLRDLLQHVVRRPHPTSGVGVTPAVFFRLNESIRPTFLIDEAEKLGGRNVNTELVGLLNDGYRKGATVYRCEANTHKVQSFDAFGFRALFAIRDLWDTVLDRSILLRLERKPRDAKLRRFRARTVEKEGRELGERVQGWAEGLLATIAEEEERAPQPQWLSDRACDNWASLFAIASLAGEPWPERALYAAKTLSVPGGADGDVNERLLRDVYEIFTEARFPEVVNSTDLAKELNDLETSSWGDMRGGQGISVSGLAKRLGAFRVKPHQARATDGVKLRGYWLGDLENVFRRYFPGAEVGHPGQAGQPSKDAPSGRPTPDVGGGTSPVAKWDGHPPSQDKTWKVGQLRPHSANDVPGVPPPAPGKPPDAATKPCIANGCTKPAIRDGYCGDDWLRFRPDRKGSPAPVGGAA